MGRIQAFRFELDPNNRQRGKLASHAGAARYAYNWGLREIKRALAAREWERRLLGAPLTQVPSASDLHRSWNTWKRVGAPWWTEVSKCAPQEALKDLDRARRAFLRSRNTARRSGFPRAKKKGRSRDSFRLTGSIGLCSDRYARLPRIGLIRTKEHVTKLIRRIDDGSARILSVTVVRDGDRWYASFAVELQVAPTVTNGRSDVVGIDVGIQTFAVLSTGETIQNPRHLQRRRGKLRRLHQAVARKQNGSHNRRKAAMRLARAHRRIRNSRTDFCHQLTTRIVRSYGTVVIERLSIQNMLRNHRLARAISDAGWGVFARQLTYKSRWNGCRLVVAAPFTPSSKVCSNCGHAKAKLTLAERSYQCEACGLVIDRDLNAALNLAKMVAASGAETENACGGRVSLGYATQHPTKQEASTSCEEKTGTAGRKQSAA